LGAARSYAGMDDEYSARQRYQAFNALWQDDSLSEVAEAKEYLGL